MPVTARAAPCLQDHKYPPWTPKNWLAANPANSRKTHCDPKFGDNATPTIQARWKHRLITYWVSAKSLGQRASNQGSNRDPECVHCRRQCFGLFADIESVGNGTTSLRIGRRAPIASESVYEDYPENNGLSCRRPISWVSFIVRTLPAYDDRFLTAVERCRKERGRCRKRYIGSSSIFQNTCFLTWHTGDASTLDPRVDGTSN